MDAHDLIAKLKELALELGRPPTRAEFEMSVRGGKHNLQKAFGNYNTMLTAAGFETYSEKRKKPKGNEIFKSDIDSHIARYQDSILIPKINAPVKHPFPKVAALGDTHLPFRNDKVFSEFKLYVEKNQPDYIIQEGDLFDMYSHGKFPRSHNLFTPKQEEQTARRMAEEFWAAMRKAAPKAKLVQLLGNHDVRPLKRVIEVMPQAEHWIEKYFEDLMRFDGVETILDPRQEYFINDIAFFHGYRTQLGAHRDYTLFNTVNGHTHRGGVSYRQIRGVVLFELNCGLAGDPRAKGLSYTAQKISDWTPGYGAIDSYGPRFIPVD